MEDRIFVNECFLLTQSIYARLSMVTTKLKHNLVASGSLKIVAVAIGPTVQYIVPAFAWANNNNCVEGAGNLNSIFLIFCYY
jgi:hypothetical protein